MILFVAPYSPASSCSHPHLGAARKIEAIIKSLSQIGEVVLLNSAHNECKHAWFRNESIRVGGTTVQQIIMPSLRSRPLGKLLNLFQVNTALDKVHDLFDPKLVWIYNAYAFESRVAIAAKKRFRAKLILEFEDAIFSRSRGWNPKPYIDNIESQRMLAVIDYGFVVNAELGKHLANAGKPFTLLPGIVPDSITNFTFSEPFQSSETITVGYFGGLNREKGADVVLQIAEIADSNMRFIVTGRGELEGVFSTSSRGNLSYHGAVDDQRLIELIDNCDVILNPHTSIEKMSGGVFPFKVIEAIASGRLVLSTKLPCDGLQSVLAGVHFLKRDPIEFRDAIRAAKRTYNKNLQAIQSSSIATKGQFGSGAVRMIAEGLLSSAD